MKTQNNTFGVIFYLRKYKATNGGKTPIYARITVNGHRTNVSVKRSIDPPNWNANKGMAKGSKEEVVKLNKFLEHYRSGILESYQQLLLQKKLITAELVKDKFTGYMKNRRKELVKNLMCIGLIMRRVKFDHLTCTKTTRLFINPFPQIYFFEFWG